MTSEIGGEIRYEAIPYVFDIRRADVISHIMRTACEFETVFTDYVRACDERCFACEKCATAMMSVSQMLSRRDALIWEVWRTDGADPLLVGIVYLTEIEAGVDALAHYIFFDRELRDKTELLRSMLEWFFTPHAEVGWEPLRRVTVEIPDFAFALAKHAQRYLGFGGDFSLTLNAKTPLRVEGVKRSAFRWRGVDRNLLVMGCVNERSN